MDEALSILARIELDLNTLAEETHGHVVELEKELQVVEKQLDKLYAEGMDLLKVSGNEGRSEEKRLAKIVSVYQSLLTRKHELLALLVAESENYFTVG